MGGEVRKSYRRASTTIMERWEARGGREFVHLGGWGDVESLRANEGRGARVCLLCWWTVRGIRFALAASL